ncbi:hypothetical protein Dalk_5278 [Desulfatibacillum aliphaticivorans]|uniref:Uncharacterized protein n=1 Tax=Desulfatibacillum aliphaticivorans TaxID=218208 RepID=B8FEG7_DESAL|nr:hypothetical protein Dalk_5278 [Desulfatibacillum aliphaticivorans]
MHKSYFPSCGVAGPIAPAVRINHLGLIGCIPNKCAGCSHMFEGSCTRGLDAVGRYLHLDHGPCGVPGPTDPVLYESRYIAAKAAIPRKCAACSFLEFEMVQGFICSKDKDIWGDFPRSLDWGAWSPDSLYFDLGPSKNATKQLSVCVQNNNLAGFIEEYRRVNPGLSLYEAKADLATLREILINA